MDTLVKERNRTKFRSVNALIERSKRQLDNRVEKNLFIPHTLRNRRTGLLNDYSWSDTVWYEI